LQNDTLSHIPFSFAQEHIYYHCEILFSYRLQPSTVLYLDCLLNQKCLPATTLPGWLTVRVSQQFTTARDVHFRIRVAITTSAFLICIHKMNADPSAYNAAVSVTEATTPLSPIDYGYEEIVVPSFSCRRYSGKSSSRLCLDRSQMLPQSSQHWGELDEEDKDDDKGKDVLYFGSRATDAPPPPPPPLPPAWDVDTYMSPDRLARKQRKFSRRGGACYASLLRSAVQASMSSSHEDGPCASDDEDFPRVLSRHNSGSVVSVPDSNYAHVPNPHKRARKVDVAWAPDSDAPTEEDVIARASDLLGHLCVDQQQRRPDGRPVRRVSRRTSYDSRLSEISDGDNSFSGDYA
jgi:hypothetical protein